MSFASSQTTCHHHPEPAVLKQSINGTSNFSAKSERLPRITLCPASYYGFDPITLYEPPKEPIARMAQYLCALFRRQREPDVDLGASYDSFSKPPAWMKYEHRECDEPKRQSKHKRCVSSLAFFLGFFLASASMLIIVATVLAHKHSIQRDYGRSLDSGDSPSAARQQQQPLDRLELEFNCTSTYNSVNMFNNIARHRNDSIVSRPRWTQLDEAYPGFTAKSKTPGIEIEPKALRPIFNADVPYNVLPWSILRISDTSSMCFQLKNTKNENTITVKITRLHHSSQSKSILVDRSAFKALSIDVKSFNTTIDITAVICKDTSTRTKQ